MNGTHAGIQKLYALTPEKTPENVEDPYGTNPYSKVANWNLLGKSNPTTIKPIIQISVTTILVEMMEFAIWEITILRRKKTDIGVLAEWDSRAKTARVSTNQSFFIRFFF